MQLEKTGKTGNEASFFTLHLNALSPYIGLNFTVFSTATLETDGTCNWEYMFAYIYPCEALNGTRPTVSVLVHADKCAQKRVT